jgi:hypothetical protein
VTIRGLEVGWQKAYSISRLVGDSFRDARERVDGLRVRLPRRVPQRLSAARSDGDGQRGAKQLDLLLIVAQQQRLASALVKLSNARQRQWFRRFLELPLCRYRSSPWMRAKSWRQNNFADLVPSLCSAALRKAPKPLAI